MHAVDNILSNYKSEPISVQTNLVRLLNHGQLSQTGRLMILAVDQGFEHGPVRSFYQNLDAMNPDYHFQMACDGGFSGYTAPLGWLQSSVDKFVGKVPLILKLNSSNSLYASSNPPDQAQTASVDDAVRLGCVGIGLTLYPGSDENLDLIREARELIEEARSKGLISVVWSYPRGGVLTAEDETALDVIAYGAHMACLLGAHIVKVKLPTERIAMDKHHEYYQGIAKDTLQDRVRHVVQCCFEGKRIVIFSGGASKSDEAMLSDTHAIREGGGFGAIMGRNIFQRPKENAILRINDMMQILKS